MSAPIRHRRVAAVLAATALLVGGLVALTSGAASAKDENVASAPLVEDFSYPDGSADPGITLTRGDGNLVKVECVLGETQIKAVSLDDRGIKNDYCFQLRGDHGFVEMVLVGAFQVWADDTHEVVAHYTVEGESETTTVQPNDLEGIGIGESRDAATLLELRI
ncbi:hypothetical protein [Actinoplanes sp. NPDC048796]|uniref:hypothetical protein n=1 Tax=unclassified Actinoplanes TaxID=2626549 RepID=UPI003411A5BA